MGQTIAEALREEGKLEGERQGMQKLLVSQMKRKFGRKVTAAIVSAIEQTTDLTRLDEWAGNILEATTVEEVGIPTRK